MACEVFPPWLKDEVRRAVHDTASLLFELLCGGETWRLRLTESAAVATRWSECTETGGQKLEQGDADGRAGKLFNESGAGGRRRIGFEGIWIVRI